MAIWRNIAANYLGRAYTILSSLIFIPFYIRYLGVDSYGVIAFYTIILTLSATADVGLSAAFSREAARESDPDAIARVLTSIEWVLYAALAVVAVVLVAGADSIATHWLKPSPSLEPRQVEAALRLMGLTIVPQIGISLYIAGLLGMQRQGAANLIQALYITVRGGLVIPLIALAPRLDLFFAWQLGAGILFAFAARVYLLRMLGKRMFFWDRFSWDRIRPMIAFAGGMLSISVFSSLNTQLDKVVVSALFATKDLGYYTLAGMAAQLPYAGTLPILVAALPHLTRLQAERQSERIDALFRTYSLLISTLAGVSAAALFFFARDLLSLWLPGQILPEQFIEATQILAVGGLFLSLASVPFYLGLAHGYNRAAMAMAVVTIFATGPAVLILAPRFGLTGAALPFAAFNIISFAVLFTAVARKFYGGNPAKLLLSAIIVPLALAVLAIAAAKAVTTSYSLTGLSAVLLVATVAFAEVGAVIGVARRHLTFS